MTIFIDLSKDKDTLNSDKRENIMEHEKEERKEIPSFSSSMFNKIGNDGEKNGSSEISGSEPMLNNGTTGSKPLDPGKEKLSNAGSLTLEDFEKEDIERDERTQFNTSKEVKLSSDNNSSEKFKGKGVTLDIHADQFDWILKSIKEFCYSVKEIK